MSYRPTVRGRRLVRELRRLRDQRGLTLQEAALRAGWSRARVSRLETGQVRPHHEDVAELLDAYGVTGGERADLVALAREARKRGWWTAYGDVVSANYVAMEDEAGLIRSWMPQVVHALLRTDAYARAVACGVPAEAPRVERRVAAERSRRGLLGRADAPALHVVMDESVLRRAVGGPAVLAGQLAELARQAVRPGVTVQVLPFSAGAHVGLSGGFSLLSYPDPEDPDVAYVDSAMGGIEDQAAEPFVDRFALLTRVALSPEESLALFRPK